MSCSRWCNKSWPLLCGVNALIIATWFGGGVVPSNACKAFLLFWLGFAIASAVGASHQYILASAGGTTISFYLLIVTLRVPLEYVDYVDYSFVVPTALGAYNVIGYELEARLHSLGLRCSRWLISVAVGESLHIATAHWSGYMDNYSGWSEVAYLACTTGVYVFTFFGVVREAERVFEQPRLDAGVAHESRARLALNTLWPKLVGISALVVACGLAGTLPPVNAAAPFVVYWLGHTFASLLRETQRYIVGSCGGAVLNSYLAVQLLQLPTKFHFDYINYSFMVPAAFGAFNVLGNQLEKQLSIVDGGRWPLVVVVGSLLNIIKAKNSGYGDHFVFWEWGLYAIGSVSMYIFTFVAVIRDLEVMLAEPPECAYDEIDESDDE